jgi:outer membrane protein
MTKRKPITKRTFVANYITMFRLVIVLCCLIPLNVLAQDKEWTLKECVDYAIENNLSIKDQSINVERNTITLNKNKMDRMPTLNSSASHNYNFGRTIDPFTNQYGKQTIQSNSFSLVSSVTLYNGFRLQNAIKRSQNDAVMNSFQIEVIRNQVSLSVIEAFLQIVYGEKQLQIVQNQAVSTIAQLEQTEKLMDAGTVNKSSYLTLKAQRSRDNWSIQSAKGSIRLAYVNLLSIMQIPDNQNFKISIPNLDNAPTVPLSSLNEVVETGLESMPELKVANAQLKTNELNVLIAESGIYPRLTLFGNLSTLYSGSRQEFFNPKETIRPIGYVDGSLDPVLAQFTSYDTRTTDLGKQISDNFGQALGFNLSIPIFNNHQVKTNVAEARLNQKSGEINLDRTKNQIRSDIARSYTNFENASALYAAAIQDEASQRENYEFAQKRFEAGLLTTTELLLIKTGWASALNELERSKFELIFTNTQVLLYQTGKIQLPSE